MSRKDVCNTEDAPFFGPTQRIKCRNKGCFRNFSNQQPHDIGACWPLGIVGKRGRPAPTVMADGTRVPGLAWKTRDRKEAVSA